MTVVPAEVDMPVLMTTVPVVGLVPGGVVAALYGAVESAVAGDSAVTVPLVPFEAEVVEAVTVLTNAFLRLKLLNMVVILSA